MFRCMVRRVDCLSKVMRQALDRIWIWRLRLIIQTQAVMAPQLHLTRYLYVLHTFKNLNQYNQLLFNFDVDNCMF